MLEVIELLRLRGLDTTKPTKLVRHSHNSLDLYDFMIQGHFETFQKVQAKNHFDCEQIVSFLALPNNQARFIGVYEVGDHCFVKDTKLPPKYPYPDEDPDYLFYDLTKLSGFEDLEQRVIIYWGPRGSTRAWHQWIYKDRPKEVVEVVATGYTRPFPGYLDFTLTFEELSRIIRYPEANREWHTSLSNVAGVYLILDKKSGKQYVGSAYGKSGLLGRWWTYTDTLHGNNALLIQLLEKHPQRYRDFQFAVLRTLSKGLTNNEVIQYESMYKNVLGSRAFGLNSN